MQRIAKDGRIVEVGVTATALVNESGEAYAIATTERKNGDRLSEEARSAWAEGESRRRSRAGLRERAEE